MDVTVKKVIETNFLGKYLIPTDNIRQQSSDILKMYIQEMSEEKDVPPIIVTTSPASHEGEIIPVSEILKMHEPIYILDGHHRFIANLNPAAKNYQLKALFINMEADQRDIGTLYDYLEAYEYWEKADVI